MVEDVDELVKIQLCFPLKTDTMYCDKQESSSTLLRKFVHHHVVPLNCISLMNSIVKNLQQCLRISQIRNATAT